MTRACLAVLVLACTPRLTLATGPDCREARLPPRPWDASSEDGIDRLRQERDVDGDGRMDTMQVEDSSGSSSGLRSVTLTMGDGTRLRADYEYNFAGLVQTVPIPAALLDSRHRREREHVEDALFGRTCAVPDPSLQRLQSAGAPLRSIPGPLALPDTYALRSGDEWLVYLGHNHAYRMGKGPVEPVVLAERGGQVLLGTPHAVIITDLTRTRHAWLYVSQPEHKMRFPSVLSARFEGNNAVITLSRGDGSFPERATRLVRVDLQTGKIRGEAP